MLFEELVKHNIIIEGNFTLKSGQKSNYYVDIKKAISIPYLFNTIVDLLISNIKQIPDLDNCCIVGVPYSGIPFASVISYKTNIPLILLRKNKKNYGSEKIFEGDIGTKNIILIEDVMTTGSSIFETIHLFEELGYTVKYIFTIFQRGNLNYSTFSQKNIEYNYLISEQRNLNSKLTELSSIHPIYDQLNIISANKKSNLILSVDKQNIQEVKNIIRICGNHIVAVKIHMDIYDESERDELRYFLNKSKLDYDFLVIEDRKFADICSTNLLQMQALKVEEYADIVICHGIAGFKFTEEIKLPVLLVSQLSNFGNLIDETYTKKCITAVRNHVNIIGCISQSNLGYNKCIYCKPGIRLGDIKTDNLDQQYSGKSAGIDFYIIGRGIINSENILNVCLKYKKELYN